METVATKDSRLIMEIKQILDSRIDFKCEEEKEVENYSFSADKLNVFTVGNNLFYGFVCPCTQTKIYFPWYSLKVYSFFPYQHEVSVICPNCDGCITLKFLEYKEEEKEDMKFKQGQIIVINDHVYKIIFTFNNHTVRIENSENNTEMFIPEEIIESALKGDAKLYSPVEVEK